MKKQLVQLEINLLFTAILTIYGYDFNDYARTSMHRRLIDVLDKYDIDNLGQFQHEIINNREFFYRTLNDLTITVSDLFRNPSMYSSLVKNVLCEFSGVDSFKVWHAGCATGEEVYSLAILLREAKLNERAIVYATDINQKAIDYAKNGIFSMKSISQGEKNYREVCANGEFCQYYLSNKENVVFDPMLNKNVVFSKHNLATDYSFGEMQLILCRNVLIYFNQKLQNRVLRLFTESLSIGGYLCLGSKETLRFSDVEHCFEDIDKNERIYRKIKEPTK